MRNATKASTIGKPHIHSEGVYFPATLWYTISVVNEKGYNMSRTGKSKVVYVKIPYKLYAAILQDIESRPRGISVEHAVQECIRDKYSTAKIKREYLVRAGNEVAGMPEGTGEIPSPLAGKAFSSGYAAAHANHDRHMAPARERKLQRKRTRENFRSQLDMMTGGAH